MVDALLIDTDALIDCLRGRQESTTFLEALSRQPMVSAVSVCEPYAGVGDDERDGLAHFLAALSVVPVTDDIAGAGGLYRRDDGPSYGTGLVDGLIAATTCAVGARHVTLNRRHYPMLEDLLVPY